MFAGQVLSRHGWANPRSGLEIAYLSKGELVAWREITSCSAAHVELLTVNSQLLSMAVTLDHYLLTHQHGRVSSIPAARLCDRGKALQLKHGHITGAYPAAHSGQGDGLLMSRFVSRHFGGPCVPEHVGPLLSGEPTRPLWPHICLATDAGHDDYHLGLGAVLAFVSRIWSWFRPAGDTGCTYQFAGNASEMMQVLLFFAGITSIMRGDTLHVYLRTRSYSSPVRPTITPRAVIQREQGHAWAIDVPHPIVRNNGYVVAL